MNEWMEMLGRLNEGICMKTPYIFLVESDFTHGELFSGSRPQALCSGPRFLELPS